MNKFMDFIKKKYIYVICAIAIIIILVLFIVAVAGGESKTDNQQTTNVAAITVEKETTEEITIGTTKNAVTEFESESTSIEASTELTTEIATTPVKEETTTEMPTTTEKETETTTKVIETTVQITEHTTPEETTEEETIMSQRAMIEAIEMSAEFQAVANNEVNQGYYYAYYEDVYLPTAKVTIPAGLYPMEPGSDMTQISIGSLEHNNERIDILLADTTMEVCLAEYIDIGYVDLNWLLQHKYEPNN